MYSARETFCIQLQEGTIIYLDTAQIYICTYAYRALSQTVVTANNSYYTLELLNFAINLLA